MRVALHVAREQARHGALVLAIAWTAATLLGAAVVWLDGDLPARDGLPAFVLGIAALAFVPSVGVAMPLSIVVHALRMRDDGEWVAAAIGGVSCLTLAGALVAPWLPVVALVGDHAHAVRPAATAALVDLGTTRLREDPVRMLPALARQGVAADLRDGRARVMMPLGSGCLAVEFEHRAFAIDRCGPGRFAVLDSDGGRASGRFDALDLALPTWTRPLGARSEQELSTAFLDRSFGRYQRARASSSPMTGLWARERRRRAAVLPCTLLAMMLAAVAVVWTRGAAFWAYTILALPAIALDLLGPRLVGAW